MALSASEFLDRFEQGRLREAPALEQATIAAMPDEALTLAVQTERDPHLHALLEDEYFERLGRLVEEHPIVSLRSR